MFPKFKLLFEGSECSHQLTNANMLLQQKPEPGTRETLRWAHMKACGNLTHEFMHGEPLPLSCEFSSKRKETLVIFAALSQSNSHGTVFLSVRNSPYQNFWGCLIVPSFPHTLHAYQHFSLFWVSISETEPRPQLHVLLHFPWHNELTQGHLCLAAWIQILTSYGVCGSA